jgi:hypothetical protein
MSWNGQNIESKSQLSQFAALAVPRRSGPDRDAGIIGSDDRHAASFQEPGHTTDVI